MVKGATISIRDVNWRSAPLAVIIGRGVFPRIPWALPALALVVPSRRCDVDKDVELVVLRHQVRTVERQLHRRVRYSQADRALLAALSRLLPRAQWRAFLVTPGTLLRWHREAGRRKWRAWRRLRGPGRPAMSPGFVELVLRLGRENLSCGCARTQGELRKLGARAGATSLRRVLRRGVPRPRHLAV